MEDHWLRTEESALPHVSPNLSGHPGRVEPGWFQAHSPSWVTPRGYTPCQEGLTAMRECAEGGGAARPARCGPRRVLLAQSGKLARRVAMIPRLRWMSKALST